MESLPLLRNELINNQSTQDELALRKEISPENISVTSSKDLSFALLDQLFPEQKREDKTIKEARIILGDLMKRFSSEELQEIIVIHKYLTETWLDMWERKQFGGETLNELLNLG